MLPPIALSPNSTRTTTSQLGAETIELFYEANHYKDVRFVALPMELIRSGRR
ncbi:MAG: hypothetical protein GY903_25675 [Fuerstiella sp.]|nr:hypothetical protein [Fuerstiella sp.]MCP4857887.1 hypothetical protein [Fuerstiella sp.]